MKNDHKDVEQKPEAKTFFEKLEQATPTQVSQAVIAQVMQKLKKRTTSTEEKI